MQREAGADVPPQRGEVDLGEQPAPMVAEPLVCDQCSSFGNRRLQTECTQRPSRVAWQVDARPDGRPGGFPLDHLGGEPPVPERSGDAETRDPGADHENARTGPATSTGAVSHRISLDPSLWARQAPSQW